MLVRALWMAMGILLGVAIASFYWPLSSAPVPQLARVNFHLPAPAPLAMPRELPIKNVTESRPAATEPHAFQMVGALKESAPMPRTIPVVAQPQKLNVRLEEEVVDEMEREASHLREMGHTVRTGEGWRIYLTSADHVFGKAGFSSGDLIPFETIQNELQNPSRARLAYRLVGVLNAIEEAR